ncbi:MAG: beta-1,6-N-acetylglucosaminyltransferase [Prevotellaceae bacterium]|nr:beta-1,6-N-acetylglucosaminyltransferase [Prevotellaceae bacterium]
MIQKNCIILAHTNASQLKRLIERLDSKNTAFYIHIDKKSDIRQFTDIIKGENIKFIENRIDCLWGDFSQIRATLNLIEAVLNDKQGGFVIQLTGQDYPVKSNDYINKYIENHADTNFVDCIPVENIWKNYKIRTESYKFNVSKGRGNVRTFNKISKSSLKSFFKGEITFGNLIILLKKRYLPLKQYGGSAWWAMNTDTMQKFFDYYKQNEKMLVDFFAYTLCPDETFFATVIKAVQNQDNSIKIEPSFTFVDWKKAGESAASPELLTINNLEQLKSLPQQWLFARKFDTNVDEKILDELDKI